MGRSIGPGQVNGPSAQTQDEHIALAGLKRIDSSIPLGELAIVVLGVLGRHARLHARASRTEIRNEQEHG